MVVVTAVAAPSLPAAGSGSGRRRGLVPGSMVYVRVGENGHGGGSDILTQGGGGGLSLVLSGGAVGLSSPDSVPSVVVTFELR